MTTRQFKLTGISVTVALCAITCWRVLAWYYGPTQVALRTAEAQDECRALLNWGHAEACDHKALAQIYRAMITPPPAKTAAEVDADNAAEAAEVRALITEGDKEAAHKAH